MDIELSHLLAGDDSGRSADDQHAFAMATFTAILQPFRDELPQVGRDALLAAQRHWQSPAAPRAPLVNHRIACWQYLDDKNGNSTTIFDLEDVAMRTLIACLFEDNDQDPGQTIEFMESMLSRLGVSQTDLDATITELQTRSE